MNDKTSYPSSTPTQSLSLSSTTQHNQQLRHHQLQSQQLIHKIKQQINFTASKLSQLKNKKYTNSDKQQWKNLQQDIEDVQRHLNYQLPFDKVFQRKFCDQFRLLHDLFNKQYAKSCIQAYFVFCPSSVLKKFKTYEFVDQVFQRTVSRLPKVQRNIYFYVILLYTKLFLLYALVKDKYQEQKNRQMVQIIHMESKNYLQTLHLEHLEKKLSTKQKGKINKILVQKHLKIKELKHKMQNKQDSDFLQLSHKNKQNDKTKKDKQLKNPSQKISNPTIKSYKAEFANLYHQIHKLCLKDWHQIIQDQEWSQSSHRGFIQLGSSTPFPTFLQFKDCKMKTGLLFQQLSSTSFDFRAYLIRKSKIPKKSHHYILQPLYDDLFKLNFRFWLQEQPQKLNQSTQLIQKFILQIMRIGVKQKLARMCLKPYHQKLKDWLINNYLHLSIKQQYSRSRSRINTSSVRQSQVQHQQNENQNQNNQQQKQDLWWVNLGQSLIKSIIQVANKKINKRNSKLKSFKSFSNNQKSSKAVLFPNQNPQSNQRLNKLKSRKSVYQI